MDFAVGAEGKVIFDKLTFIRVIVLLFSTYFVLNMEYPTMAAATMEFILRYRYTLVFNVIALQSVHIGYMVMTPTGALGSELLSCHNNAASVMCTLMGFMAIVSLDDYKCPFLNCGF